MVNSDFKTGDTVWYMHHQWQGSQLGYVKVKTKGRILKTWRDTNRYDMFSLKLEQEICGLYGTFKDDVYALHTELIKI